MFESLFDSAFEFADTASMALDFGYEIPSDFADIATPDFTSDLGYVIGESGSLFDTGQAIDNDFFNVSQLAKPLISGIGAGLAKTAANAGKGSNSSRQQTPQLRFSPNSSAANSPVVRSNQFRSSDQEQFYNQWLQRMRYFAAIQPPGLNKSTGQVS
jgi:hypothetical protein